MYSEFSTDPRNWLKGPTAPWDRYQVSDPAPGPSDHLYFLGGLSSNNCTIPQPSYTVDGVAFAGLHLLFGPISLGTGVGTPGVPLPPPPPPQAYAGTVTTAGSFTVGTLVVDCGNIKQADPATVDDLFDPDAGTLTVKTTFDWTGGTLNSNTVAGTIALAPGATGIAEPSFTNPGINGTVKLGSDLILQGTEAVFPLPSLGSTLSMIGGTFEVYNDSTIVGEEYSTLLLVPADKPAEPGSPPPPVPIKTITVDKKDETPNNGVINIKPKSTAIVEPPLGATGPGVLELKGKGGKFTNNGTTTIKGQTEVKFTDLGDRDDCFLQSDAAAVAKLFGGSSITANKKNTVNIEKGELQIIQRVVNGEPTVAKVAMQYDAGSALIIRKDATLKMSDSTDTRLEVTGGDLAIYGTLSVAINPRGPEASHITVEKNMFFHDVPGESKAKVEVINRSSGDGSQLPVNTEWKIATTSAVGGTPEMTANSTDYTTTVTPISGEKLYVKRIQ